MARKSCAFTRLLFAGIFVLCALCVSQRTAFGFAHVWQITEVFSNADGSVQFVEMFDNFNNEHFIAGSTLNSDSDGVLKSYSFPSNIGTSATANHYLLIATPGFAALSGVTPDYFFPAGFKLFNPTATQIEISFSASGNSLSSEMGSFPINGVLSLTNSGIASNTPTNFAGLVGHVDLSTSTPDGDYNGNGVVDAADYVLWRKTLNQPVEPDGSGADGDGDGMVDTGDYTFWRERFGQDVDGAGASLGGAIPEPATGAIALAAGVAIGFSCRRRPGRHTLEQ